MSGIVQGLLASFSSAAAVVTDAYFNLVTLLLNTTTTNGAQNNTFLDSSSNNFTITRNGNTTQGTFTPFSQTGWSNYFSSTGSDYLTAPANAAFALGSNSFTIEGWIYPTATYGTYNFIYNRASGGTNATTEIEVWIPAAGTLRLLCYVGSTQYTTETIATVPLNAWTHFAAVKNGTSTQIYLNGVANGTPTTVTGSLNNTSSTPYIGNQYVGGRGLVGYISNFRLVNGTAVYTSNFTPSTTPLTAITNTSLLTCQSNRFVDNSTANSGSGFPITVGGTPSVQAFSPFAPTAAYSTTTVGGSGYFDGTGDYLTTPNVTALNLYNTTNTVECWIYPLSFSNSLQIYGTDFDGNYYTVWSVNATTGTPFYQSRNGTTITGSTGLKLNQWNHVAWGRSGTTGATVSIWLNGARIANGTISIEDAWGTGNIIIGRFNGLDRMYGYLSGLRVVKGTDVYGVSNTTLTVPTAPFTASMSANPFGGSNTAAATATLLLNFTNAGIFDAAAKNDLETVGAAQVVSPTPSKFGNSSMSFNASGNGLQFPSNPLFNMGTGDFTIELWAYVTDLTNYRGVFQISPTAGGYSTTITTTLGLDFKSGGTGFEVYAKGASNQVTYSVSTNTWYYLAIVRSGTTTTFYVNGTSQATYTADSTNYAGPFLGIGNIYSGAYPFSGYIDEFRITRYARTITASPTAAFPVQ